MIQLSKYSIEYYELLFIMEELPAYEVINFIDYGTTSNVYKVVEKRSGMVYAAKVINRKNMETLGLTLEIEQETRVHRSISHPNIVKIFDVKYTSENIILILEYCSNGDLCKFVDSGCMCGERAIKNIFKQVVDAVYYLHHHKISHKDLKPENILLDGNMECKLADFGCCQTVIKKLKPERFASVEYAPPEFFLKPKQDGMKFDIWSLGIILYFLYTGSTPWKKENYEDNIKDIIAANVDYSSLPQDVADFIKYLLIPNPEARPTIDMVMAADYFVSCQQSLIPQLTVRYPYEKMKIGKIGAATGRVFQHKSNFCVRMKQHNYLLKPINPIRKTSQVKHLSVSQSNVSVLCL